MTDDEERFVGMPTGDVPTREPTDEDCMGKRKQRRDGEILRGPEGNPLFAGYCRLAAGWNTDHNGEGRCSHHGGNLEPMEGEDNPSFRHGLFSDHLGEQDREDLEAIAAMSNAEKLKSVLDWRLVRLRRAVAALNDEADQRTFWDAFAEIVTQTGEVETDEIRELANMLDRGNRAMQDEVDLVRKLIKDLDSITDESADELNVNHSLDDEQIAALREDISDAYGGG